MCFILQLLNFYVKFVNIKYLKLDISLRKDHDFYALRCVCRLVEACRSLEKLVIKVIINWVYYSICLCTFDTVFIICVAASTVAVQACCI